MFVRLSEQTQGYEHCVRSHHNERWRMIVLASQSYKGRMRAARAQCAAREAEWRRRIELSVEVRRLALDAVKARDTPQREQAIALLPC